MQRTIVRERVEKDHFNEMITVKLISADIEMDDDLPAKYQKPQKILVVEDEPINQTVAKLFLNNFGYEADIATNGYEAIAMFNKGYSLILMDLGLPDMDGLEITRRIRELEQGSGTHATIIAATASGESYRGKCLAAGMDDFLLKPIMLNDLKEMLDKYDKK